MWIWFFFYKSRSTKRNNTCFNQDSAHSRVTKGRTVHAKWTAIYFVQSSTDECKYQELNGLLPCYFILHTYANFPFSLRCVLQYILLLKHGLLTYIKVNDKWYVPTSGYERPDKRIRTSLQMIWLSRDMLNKLFQENWHSAFIYFEIQFK